MAALKLLRPGSRGPQVEFLQLALERAGFLSDPPDGIFGSNTQFAVLAFQESRDLVKDSIVGPKTWQALTPYMTGYVSYTIKRDDTLYNLASAYGTTMRAIETANPGLDPLNLQIGSIITIPLAFEVTPINISFTSTVLEYTVRGLKARYPFIRTGSIGSSVMGKSLHYLTIGTGRNEVFYNGSHHANEWITTPLLLRFMEEYCEAYAYGRRISEISAASLYNLSKLYILPMTNPDGVDLVTGELSSGMYFNQATYISENFPDIPFPNGWKANINGTDLNLQYPAGWALAREIKFAQGFTRPAPRDYVGPTPLSAPESLSVYSFTLAHNFSLTLSYHAQGEVIYWKYRDYEPENSFAIAQKFGSLSGYTVEETPALSGNAGYKDWFIEKYNRPGYTIEVGLGVSPLPLSQFDKIYRNNIGILTYGLSATA